MDGLLFHFLSMMMICHFEAMDSMMRFQFRFLSTETITMLYALGENGFYIAILAWFLIGMHRQDLETGLILKMANTRKEPTMSERKQRAISSKRQESQVTTRAPSNLQNCTSESSGGGAIPGGPEDFSVLTSFESHIAYAIWNNPAARKPLKDPYHAHQDVHLLQEFVYYNGLLICFNVVELYYPDRVLRQFGRVQAVPKTTMKPSND
ncbi:hypothetical protein LguiB_012669 [Lonicera macranthoides]